MRIALVVASKKSKLYPIGLMRISAWQKSLGNTCDLFVNKLPTAGVYDEIWVSTIFLFEAPYSVGFVREAVNRAAVVRVGGIAATLRPDIYEAVGGVVHKGVIREAEAMPADYSILPTKPEYAIVHTSRGCTRRCGFCAVHKVEPTFYDVLDWEKDVYDGCRRILFYDNNWLAKPSISHDVEIIKRLQRRTPSLTVDFNQALDARLVTENTGNLLRGVRIVPVRFAFDGMHEDGYVQRAVEIMARNGHKEFTVFCLYNFKDTTKDFYQRLRTSAELSERIGVSVTAYPMRYQPIDEIDANREYVGTHWTKQKKKGFMNILNKQSLFGQVSHSRVSDFEYWFGRDADEFDRLIAYPKIGELMKKRKGARRTKG